MKNQVSPKWGEALKDELESPNMLKIVQRIKRDLRQEQVVKPSSENLFQRFKLIDPEDVRVVFFVDQPVVKYEDDKNWPLLASWIETQYFEGLNLNVEDNMDYLIPQGVITLSPSLTTCKTDHSDIGWGTFVHKILDTLYKSPNKVLFVSNSPQIKEAIPFDSTCLMRIDEFMREQYNTKIK